MATYYVDPINGNKNNSGTSWNDAFQKASDVKLNPGDVVLVKKSGETKQDGTVSATFGSKVVYTTNNLSGSLSSYDCVRFDSEDVLYSIKTVSQDSITLYRPYRGQTGSGKELYKLDVINHDPLNRSTSTTSYGTKDNMIYIKYGVNPETNEQDGFTVYRYGSYLNYTYYNHFSRFSLSFIYYSEKNTFNLCYFYQRDSNTPAVYGSANSHFVNCFSDNSLTGVFYMRPLIESCNNCLFLNCHLGTSKNLGNNRVKYVNCILDDEYSLFFGNLTSMADIQFINCKIGEYYSIPYLFYSGTRDFSYVLGENTIVFRNCLINFNYFQGPNSSGYVTGSICFENYNQIEGDDRTYWFNNEPIVVGEGPVFTEMKDYSIYRTSPPSYKIVLERFCSVPWVTSPPFFVKVEKDKQTTISAWLRKNDLYGDDFGSHDLWPLTRQPKMRVRYETGTVGSGLMRQTKEVSMTASSNTWQQLSITFTHNFDTPVILEFEAISYNSGAVLWIDDITVT